MGRILTYAEPIRSKLATNEHVVHDIIRTLCYRLDVIEYYIMHSPLFKSDTNTQLYLYLFLDMHIDLFNAILHDRGSAIIQSLLPCYDRVLHCGNCMNTISFIKESGYWNLTNIKRHPIIHIFTKALPHRCQNRNMQTLSVKYMKQYPLLMQFFIDIILISLLGNYHNRYRPMFKYRCMLHGSRHNLSFWEKNIALYFPIALHSLKEHIVFCVDNIPSLHDTLCLKQRWMEFKQGIHKILQPGRLEMQKNSNYSSIEQLLKTVDSASRYNLGRHIHHHTTKYNVLQNRFKAAAKRIYALVGEDGVHTPPKDLLQGRKHFLLLYNIACRIPLHRCNIPWFLMTAFGVRRSEIRKLYQKKKVILEMTSYEKGIIRTFVDTLSLRFGIQSFSLSTHIMQLQLDNTRKRFGLAPDCTWQAAAACHAPFVFCACCKSFKGFLNHISKKQNAVCGYGNKEVLINDDNGLFYCANHKHKRHAHKQKNIHSILSKLQQNNRRPRSRSSKYLQCERTELLQFSSFGTCISFFGNVFLRCPICIQPCVYSSMQFIQDTLICVVCAHSQKKQ